MKGIAVLYLMLGVFSVQLFVSAYWQVCRPNMTRMVAFIVLITLCWPWAYYELMKSQNTTINRNQP